MAINAKAVVEANSGLNLRADGGTHSDVIGGFDNGQEINVVDSKVDGGGTTWYKVDGTDGWVSGDYIKLSSSDMSSVEDITGTANDVTDPSATKQTEGEIAASIDSEGTGLDSIMNELLGTSLTSEKEGVYLKRRVFGLPHQFIKSADIRLQKNGTLGRFYLSNILKESHILSLIPGLPSYLPELSEETRDGYTKAALDFAKNINNAQQKLAETALSSFTGDLETRFFEFKQCHTRYISYVNFLCRTASVFMKIGNENVPGTMTKYCDYNWANYTLSNIVANKPSDSPLETLKNQEGAKEMFDELKDIASTVGYYIDFVVSPSTGSSESFQNSTNKSKFEGFVRGAEDMVKELSFLLNANAIDSSVVNKSSANYMKELSQKMGNNDGLLGAGNDVLSRLLKNTGTILSGSNIIFPEIWQDFRYDKSIKVEMKLITPYGDRESIFLNLFVPFFHLMCMYLPRQTSVNSYGSPFVVRAHCRGRFSTELAIIDSLEVQKGGDGSAWTVDGFPTELNISFSIKDLYSNLMMSNTMNLNNIYNLIWNQELQEYLMIMCGLDLRRSNNDLKFEFALSMIRNIATDLFDSNVENIKESTHILIARLFGR